MERAIPGPDGIDYDARHGPNDPTYNRHHAARSARIVAAWLCEQGAPDDLIATVANLIEAREKLGYTFDRIRVPRARDAATVRAALPDAR
jgi:hypothetical protein